jgi:hypothetical protein
MNHNIQVQWKVFSAFRDGFQNSARTETFLVFRDERIGTRTQLGKAELASLDVNI